MDTRQYRSAHEKVPGVQTPVMKELLGTKQLTWLLDGLKASRATWKFIATSVPLSYPTGWPRPEETGYDGWSDGQWDTISGPEIELQKIFEQIRDGPIHNVIFLSGDVHFPFCISYDPFNQGKPLVYEIGATPFHALPLPPPERGPDNTFHPTVLYADGKFGGDLFNFGHLIIDESAKLTFIIRDVKGHSLYELKLEPTVSNGTDRKRKSEVLENVAFEPRRSMT